MSDVIIDTNVLVVANRQNSYVTEKCQDACVTFINRARAAHVVLIDSGDEIRTEYAKALLLSRPYQIGAQFLIHVLRNQFNIQFVRQIDLPKQADGAFMDFPDVPDLANFDEDDRKFAALARKTGATVTNAIDSDWVQSLAALNANGIAVKFLCGSDQTEWFKP